MIIHRSQITNERWIDTSFLRSDVKEEFRERAKFGNRHAIFKKGSQWGYVHVDKHNATDFPSGTLNHAALYTNEQTGISEDIAKIGILGIGIYAAYKILKFLDES